MPVTVIVRTAPGPHAGDAPSLTFDGSRIVIGRGQGSDVRLPDPSVSTRHASIRAKGAEYTIIDEGSTNGTWVGDVKLSPHTPRIVKNGDLIRVGRVWLEIAIGKRPATPDLGLATRDVALALVRGAMEAVGQDVVTRLRVAEGPDIGAELLLVEEGRSYVVGRAERCDLPLADEDASREHVAIVRRGSQVLVRDLDSRNGVWLGQTRIEPGRDVAWRAPTMARVGGTVLAVEEPVAAALADLEAADDEEVAERDLPLAPADGAEDEAGQASATVPAEEAALSGPLPRDSSATRRAWNATDIVVVLLAIAVIGASLAGLFWVLR